MNIFNKRIHLIFKRFKNYFKKNCLEQTTQMIFYNWDSNPLRYLASSILIHFAYKITKKSPIWFNNIFIIINITDAEFAFGIYDCDGTGKIDAYDIPDVLRSLNLNPTFELCEKMGATKKRGEKKLSLEEFLPIFSQVNFPIRKVTILLTHCYY